MPGGVGAGGEKPPATRLGGLVGRLYIPGLISLLLPQGVWLHVLNGQIPT